MFIISNPIHFSKALNMKFAREVKNFTCQFFFRILDFKDGKLGRAMVYDVIIRFSTDTKKKKNHPDDNTFKLLVNEMFN